MKYDEKECEFYSFLKRKERFTPEERKEIAEYMIELWRAWAE